MPSITDSTRLIIWIVTGIAGAVLAALTVYLEENIRLAFRKLFRQDLGGRRPREKPKFVWVLYILSMLISIIGTSIASSASSISAAPTVAQTLGVTEPILPRKPGIVRILVATFDETDQTSYRVTDVILTNLKSALSNYPETEVVATDRVITEKDGSETAIEIGELYEASIVIWGWHGLTEQSIPVGIHFDIVPASTAVTPGSCAASSTQVLNARPSELNDLTLQTDISNELSFVTLFTFGLSRFRENDWLEAIDIFNDAINYFDPTTHLAGTTHGSGVLVNQDLLYAYRSMAYFELGDYDSALADLEKINQTRSNDIYFQYNFGRIFLKKQEFQSAINQLTLAIENNPQKELASLYFLRATAYNNLGMFDNANEDFKTAFNLDDQNVSRYMIDDLPTQDALSYITNHIEENPKDFSAYYLRGVVNNRMGNVDAALQDYDNALDINPDLLIARQARVTLRTNDSRLNDPKIIVQDLDILLMSDEYKTPCNLLAAGHTYHSLGDIEKANKYYDDTISATTKEIDTHPENAAAHFVKGAVLFAKHEYAQAYIELREAKRLDPQNKNNDPVDEGLNNIVQYYISKAIRVGIILLILAIVAFVTYKSIVSFIRRKNRQKPRSRHHAHRP